MLRKFRAVWTSGIQTFRRADQYFAPLPGDEVMSRRIFSVHAVFALYYSVLASCLQCFHAVGWVAGRASGL